MIENKQTAVEWLESKLKAVKPSEFCSIETIIEWTQKAKEIEKQQMLEFWQGGIDCTQRGGTSFEQYYNETYKK